MSITFGLLLQLIPPHPPKSAVLTLVSCVQTMPCEVWDPEQYLLMLSLPNRDFPREEVSTEI